MKYYFAWILALTLSADLLPVQHIAIRHDVEDSHFLELGAQYPSVVRVGENGGDGTLIAQEWVLTAAHVAAGMARRSNGAFKVFVNDRGYSVRQVVIHPDFKEMGPNDLGLIRLDKPVQDITPTAPYQQRDEMGKLITLVGHGATKPGTGGKWKEDRQKRGATNIIDSANETHILFDFDAPETATSLEGTAGPGDSGGPAFIDIEGVPFIAGISSLGEPGNNGPGTYGAREHYVRVSAHIDWINAVLTNPPKEALANMPSRESGTAGGRTGPAGQRNMPPGIVMLEEIGLMVAERDGRIRMVGRVDQLYPKALLTGGIRPPAILIKINGESITTTKDLKTIYDALATGTLFTLEFEHNGESRHFELVK